MQMMTDTSPTKEPLHILIAIAFLPVFNKMCISVGIDLAFIENGFIYHTKYDTADRILTDSIQRAGKCSLACLCSWLLIVHPIIFMSSISSLCINVPTPPPHRDSNWSALYYCVKKRTAERQTHASLTFTGALAFNLSPLSVMQNVLALLSREANPSAVLKRERAGIFSFSLSKKWTPLPHAFCA